MGVGQAIADDYMGRCAIIYEKIVKPNLAR